MKATICGRIFSEVADFYSWDEEKKFPRYAKESEETWEIEVDSLREGEAWLAANHPEAYMGGSVVCETGDFLMLAIPNSEYGEGNYETKAARRRYANYIVERGMI